MNEILEYLPIIIPLIIVHLALAITALVSVLKQSQYKFGNKPIWIIIVLFIQIIGPILYFSFGRNNE